MLEGQAKITPKKITPIKRGSILKMRKKSPIRELPLLKRKEEEEEEEEGEVEPEYELDEDGNPLEDEDGNPILKKKPEPEPIVYAALYDNTVYFFENAQHCERFIHRPLPFIAVYHGKDQSYFPKVAVVGDIDLEEREHLARHVANTMNVVYISKDSIIQYIREHATGFDTGDLMASDKNYIEFVQHRLQCGDVRRQGYLLDDIPTTLNECSLLEDAGIVQDRVLFVGQPDDPCYHFLNEHHYHTLQKSLDKDTLWNINRDFVNYTNDLLLRKQQYDETIQSNRPAPIFDLGITPEVFQSKLGPLSTYCCVTFRDEDALCSTAFDVKHQFAIEYKGRYYTARSAETFNKLLNHPEFYCSDEVVLPSILPKKLKQSEDDLALKGYDPVFLKQPDNDEDEPFYPVMKKGNPRFVVSYGKKTFCFSNEANQELFLRRPWLYADAKLPKSMPVNREDQKLLPIIPYLEASLQKLLNRALKSLTDERPKYPFMSSHESALKYLALYLRKHNEANHPERQARVDKDMDEFLNACSLPLSLSSDDRHADENLESNIMTFQAISENRHPVPGSDMY